MEDHFTLHPPKGGINERHPRLLSTSWNNGKRIFKVMKRRKEQFRRVDPRLEFPQELRQPLFSVVVPGPADEPLEARPDVLDVVRRAEDVFRMVAGYVRVTEEGVDALVAHGVVGRDRAAARHVREEEPVRGFLVPVVRRAHDDLPALPLHRSQDHLLVAEPSPADERLVGFDVAREERAFVA